MQFSILKNAGQILAHSDWSKFEMERADWSRAFHHQRAPRYNPLLSLKCGADFGLILIGREQSRHSFAVILSLGGTTGQVSTVLMGREPSRDLLRHSSFA